MRIIIPVLLRCCSMGLGCLFLAMCSPSGGSEGMRRGFSLSYMIFNMELYRIMDNGEWIMDSIW